MPKPTLSFTADPQIRVSFQAQLAEALATPGLTGLVTLPTPDLYPRYSDYYRKLCQLPRRVRRRLQRQWKRSLSALALLLALGQAPALAATINVTTTNPNIVPGSGCSLIEAIVNANDGAQTYPDCEEGDAGADTIDLAGAVGTHTLTAVNSYLYGNNGFPVIGSEITIEGRGSTIWRDPDTDQFRIFAVNPQGNLTLNETTVSGGVAPLGGGLLNYNGTVALTNSTISGNSAGLDGGGGVLNGPYGTMTVTSSTISGNRARADFYYSGIGGGVRNLGTMTVTSSTISGNYAGRKGGGVHNYTGYFRGLTLTNTTISGNSTPGVGGGVYNNNNGPVILTNSTISGNSAGQYGGGVASRGSPPVILARTLISGNAAYFGAEVDCPTYCDITTADRFNLFGQSGLTNAEAFVGFIPGASDITATSDGIMPTTLAAILNPTLVPNGGPTQTHALVADSPAIDASPADADCPATDQRGVTRPQPQGGNCDIGAFELEVAGGLPSCATATPTTGCTVNGVPDQPCIGSASNDTILGTSDNDVIVGLGGNDVLRGRGGADLLCGGNKNDLIEGGPDGDFIEGEAGNDNLKGGNGPDRLLGGSGNDAIQGASGDDFLDGGAGNDQLQGQQGADTCVNGEQTSGCP